MLMGSGETAPAIHLLELEGFVPRDDPRLAAALAAGSQHVLRCVWLGGYARPLADGG